MVDELQLNHLTEKLSRCLLKEELKNSRIQRRVHELLSKAASKSGSSLTNSHNRELHFVFFSRPDKFLDSNERPGHVSAVNVEKTSLSGNHFCTVGISLMLFYTSRVCIHLE